MGDEPKHDDIEVGEGELLPPREVMSLVDTDPTSYAGLLGDGGGASPSADQTGGATGAAGSTANDARAVADGQASASNDPSASDQPQTVTTENTQTASSQT